MAQSFKEISFGAFIAHITNIKMPLRFAVSVENGNHGYGQVSTCFVANCEDAKVIREIELRPAVYTVLLMWLGFIADSL